jgi:hypothetical protein
MFNGAVSSESVNTPDAGLLMQLRVERAKMTKLMHYADTIARERDKWKKRALETEEANAKLADMLRRCRCKYKGDF